jgi:steroid delta-isomerase
MMSNDPLARYVALLETFDRERLDELCDMVSDDVHFRDPFNDCHGREAFRAVFSDMRDKLEELNFEVIEQAWTLRSADAHAEVSVALIRWQLNARLPAIDNRPWSVPGCSELHFTANGLVSAHLDYWDAAGQLYEKLPLLGRCLRALRHRIRVDL